MTRFHGVTLVGRPGRVMTPRSATEALVDRVLRIVGDRALRVADVGTGSGAIAVALAVGAPRAQIWATDSSAEAVELGRLNAERLGVAERVHVVEGDLLGPIPGELDVVAANLPYLPETEPDPELAAEPPEAVYAPGDGLGPYRRLLDQCADRLAADGVVVIQFRRRILGAGRPGLDELRRRLGA